METPFEVDHIRHRSRGGSNRISNLALACHGCNQQKGNQTAAEWGHPEVEKQAKVPLRDAAAVNATRYKLVEALRVFGFPIGTWTGGGAQGEWAGGAGGEGARPGYMRGR